MAVPDYQTLMLPVLQVAGDGQEHTIGEAIEIIASSFGLTDVDRKELLPSGTQFRFDNRIHWARYISETSRSFSKVPGVESFVLLNVEYTYFGTNPPYINVKFLEQFPEFVKFLNRSFEEI